MAALASIRSGASPLLLLASLSGWLVLIGLDQQPSLAALCTPSGPTPNVMLFAVASLAMIVAMMAPLLARPLSYIWHRSLGRRRLRAVTLFIAAYLAVWMIAVALLQLAAAGLMAVAGGWVGAFGLMLLWHAAPVRQTALNRCHGLPNLSAFGWRADGDALRFGFSAGVWCVGACWAAMLLPMVLAAGHLLAMPIVAAFLLVERQLPGRAPRWRLPFRLSAV